ncbi:hypothetical protein THAOC_15050 [Thalassiosira oceanica]|uniref:Uncharacterized protein n=1 Tax=Thalassiosira oceanica TaxID=159749 RepID=K0T1E5_THAOC|nr:hypothetical protein THAOC_15050 [Thalassiosira oceanica]|eukprot:EJK64237.1 hypothetical protein THAOC_15050 [Thalassiosira oceanica]
MDTKKLTKIDVIRPYQGVVDHGLKGLQIPVPLTLELCSGQAMTKHDKTLAQNGRVGGQKIFTSQGPTCIQPGPPQ